MHIGRVRIIFCLDSGCNNPMQLLKRGKPVFEVPLSRKFMQTAFKKIVKRETFERRFAALPTVKRLCIPGLESSALRNGDGDTLFSEPDLAVNITTHQCHLLPM